MTEKEREARRGEPKTPEEMDALCSKCAHKDCVHSTVQLPPKRKHEHPGCRSGRATGYVKMGGGEE